MAVTSADPTLKWTEPRQAALEHVAAGNVRKTWPLKGQGAFMVSGTSKKPRQDPYKWLIANGLIRLDAPNLRGTQVVLTAAGKARIDKDIAE